MRIIFAGTPSIAVPTLEALTQSEHEVVGVITRPDAPGKRGNKLHASPVRTWATEHGLPVLTPAKASDPGFVDEVKNLGADAAAVVAYGAILTPALLQTMKYGWINLHFSLLPAWRGAAPVQRAIMAGDQETGATTFIIEEGLDTGPVIGMLTERIRPDDTAGDLLGRLAVVGAPLMVRTLSAVADRTAEPTPQATFGASYAHKLTRDDAMVRWELPAHIVDRHIRGCTPGPGAWTTLPDGGLAKIGPVAMSAGLPATVAGQIREDDGVVWVGTGTGPVALGWIAPAGKKPMSAADWWRGARLADGAQLGDA